MESEDLTTPVRIPKNIRMGLWLWTILILYSLTWLYWFGSSVFGDTVFVFRDSTYWHMPVLGWTSQQWSSGQVPLWNDFQGLGINWVGQGTTTVFYPPVWLLAVPLGSFANRYAALLGLHVMLATANAYWSGRQMKLSRWAALLVAISYSWSGPVLIQHSNWPFLISAAWLPLALCGTWNWITSKGKLLPAVVALVMIILGGDPQAVYVVFLASFLAAVFFGKGSNVAAANSETDGLQGSPSSFRRLGRWSILLMMTVGCSLVQLWSTFDAAQQSTRVIVEKAPANIYDATVRLANGESNGQKLWQALWQGAESPAEQRSLQFSQTPWSIVSLVSPNLFGTWRDVNRRWDQVLPATDQPWNASLYLGWIPLVLALTSFSQTVRRLLPSQRLTGGHPSDERDKHWLQTVFLLSGLASFGWYGLGWLAAEVGWVDLREASVGAQVGGLHWLATWLLPGFSSFRYPAKLWQFANLCLCLLAGSSFDRLFVKNGIQFRMPFAINLILMFLTVIAFATLLHPWGIDAFTTLINRSHVDPWLGLLRVDSALSEVQMSLFQTIVAAGIFWLWLLWINSFPASPTKESDSGSPRHAIALAIVISVVMLDLAVANSWQFIKADSKCLHPSASTKSTESMLEARQDIGQSRIFYDSAATERHRQLEIQRKWGEAGAMQPVNKLAWQTMRSMRSTWMPQMHQFKPVGIVNADCTLPPAYESVLQDAVLNDAVLRNLRSEESSKKAMAKWDSYLSKLGIAAIVDTKAMSLQPGRETVVPIAIRETESILPSVWIASQIEFSPRPSMKRSALEQDVQKVWLDELENNSQFRTVFVDQELKPLKSQIEAQTENKILKYEFTDRAKTAEIDFNTPGLLCWNFRFDRGWQCEVTTENNPPFHVAAISVNRIQTGVTLPAGKHRVRWIYRPVWWTWGGPVTLGFWLILSAVGIRLILRKKTSNHD